MAFPTTSLLDDFNRGNGAPGASWGANSFPSFPAMAIATNQLAQTATFRSNYWNTQFAADQEGWATLVTLPNGTEQCYLHARLQSPNTAGAQVYCITVGGAGDWYIEKEVPAGTKTNLQTLGGPGTVTAGYKIGIRVVGTTITAWLDTGGGWTQAGTDQTDSDISGAGYIGLLGRNTATPIWDNFGGGDVVTATPGSGSLAWLRAL